jgi:hypothetical protein
MAGLNAPAGHRRSPLAKNFGANHRVGAAALSSTPVAGEGDPLTSTNKSGPQTAASVSITVRLASRFLPSIGMLVMIISA